MVFSNVFIDNSYEPSRVIPGFRGTPAGISTISAPLNASFSPESPCW